MTTPLNFTADCGSPDFSPWDYAKEDFGRCFFRICLELPLYALFAVSSAYYSGKRETIYSVPHTWNDLQSAIIYFRAILISFLALLPVIELMTNFSVLNHKVNVVEICAATFKTIAWTLHLVYTLRLKRGLSYNTRGPKPIILMWLLVACLSVSRFRSQYNEYESYDRHHHHGHIPATILFYIWLSGISLFLQGLYFLTIIPNSTHLEQRHYRSIFVDGVNVHESHSILNHESNSFVGFQEEDEDPMRLGVAKEHAGILSVLTLSWANPLMMKGSCGYLRYPDDLFELPPPISTSYVSEKFEDAGASSVQSYSLIKILHKCFGLEFYSIGILRFVADGCGFVGPILLNYLISFIEGGEDTQGEWHGYLYVGGMFTAALIGALANTHFTMFMMEINLKIRAAVITSVYKKTLLLRQSTMKDFNTGEIINYMSTDTNRIINFCPSFHAVWSLPIQIVVSLYLLYLQIGLSFLAGVIFAILLIPINKWIANKIGQLSTKMMHYKDQRTKLMSEILYGIKVLKYHSWEGFFNQRVTRIREKELKNLKGRKYLDALCVYFWATTPVIVSVLSFGTFVLLGNTLTAAKVFTSLALFNMLITPLNALPWVINGLVESWVSVKRISKLLEAEASEFSKFYSSLPIELQATHDIVLRDASFDWKNENSETCTLQDINLNIKKGQFVGILGEVGSAKTTLLFSILGELGKEQGTLCLATDFNGFGVVLQDSWIQRGTIRRNILFGKSFNVSRYSEVVTNCCLDDDLDKLELGEDTLVGENGMTLSGGQKQRLALARAIYQDKAIYLLDDIFSSVDLKVGKQLYRKCVMGSLKDKTRIVCTHQPRFLRDADIILVMDGGKIINRGPPEEILPIFFDDDFIDESSESPSPKESMDLKEESSLNFPSTDSIAPSVSTPPSPRNRFSSSVEFINKPEGNLDDENEERQEEGTINISVFRFYVNAIGRVLCVLILLSLLGMQATKNISDVWLSHWVSNSNSSQNVSAETRASADDLKASANDTENSQPIPENQQAGYSAILFLMDRIPFGANTDNNVKYYFTIFILIGLLNSIVTLARAFLFAYGGIIGGRKTHVYLLRKVLKAKMSFFDTTPIGRIINRFSSDVWGVDDSLPFILNIFLAQVYGVLGTLVITCYALPWIIVLILPLALVVHNIMQYYRHTARQLRRLSNISLSPIYAHFSETLKGLVTIRAMRVGHRFEEENECYVEANQRCQYSTQAVSCWLGFRLQMVGLLVISGAGLIGALQHRIGIADPGLIGLAISYALTLTGSLSGFVTFFTETEKEMVSVERAYEYITTIEEESRIESRVPHPYGWPSQGVICFKGVSLRYRNGLPYALRNISFETRSHEKIGILGRTGSGKSSLFQALFRIVDNYEGEITIDTVDIKRLNLKALRSKLWIITQDPLLFSGSLRENLDPKNICADENLESVIRKCQLTDLVQQIGGIDGSVGESGSMLSAGQKQLVCLARALLVNPAILCIDEATASCDLETDKIIQSTIRTSFHHTTILTVAHRVNTILNSDRVFVMDGGQIVECDVPEKLILDKSSRFYKLAQGYI